VTDDLDRAVVRAAAGGDRGLEGLADWLAASLAETLVMLLDPDEPTSGLTG
jgi:hypothetical protein